MVVVHFLSVIIWLTVFFSLTSSLGAIAKKTKLCGDEACSEKLFEGKFHRSSLANHESFLSPNENDSVNVYAIKFSDRTDLMEGALVREPAKKGNFFSMHINLDDYVEFLKNAVVSNKTMFMISRDPRDHPSHRLVGIKAALPELIKDYEVNAKRLSVERQLPTEEIDYAALGYFSDTEGHGHSHNHEHRHSHNHEHYHDRGMHLDSHEHIQTLQHTVQPVVLHSETTAVPPLPALNVPTNKRQEASVETTTSVQPQEMPVLGSKFNVVSEIPVQQNLMHETASLMSQPDSESASNTIPNVPEIVVPELSSVVQEASAMSENFPLSDTADVNFVKESNLPQTKSSQEKIPPAANIVNTEKLLPTQFPQPMSTEQVNTKLAPPQVMNTPSSAAILESNLPPTPQINLSLSSSLPNTPQTATPMPTPPQPSVAVVSDGTPLVPMDIAHSDPRHISSPSSSQASYRITESETPSSSNTAAVYTDQNVLPVSSFPHTEPTTTTFSASQFDPVIVSSEFGSTMKIELKPGLGEKDVIETTTVNLPLEPPPVPPITSNILQDSIHSHAMNPSGTEDIPHDEQIAKTNPMAEINTERENIDKPVQTNNEVKTDIIEEDGLGYCIKGGCDKVYNSAVVDEKTETGYLFVIGGLLSKLIGIARYILPLSMSNFDDAGILVTFFVPICLLIHLLRVLVFADTYDKDNFDRRILHNALTTIRQREIQIKLLQTEMEKGKNSWNTEMNEKFENLRSEMNQLKAKYHMLEEENDKLKAETDETSQMIEREHLKCKDLMERNKNLEEKNEMLKRQSSEIHATVEVLHKENERLVDEVAGKSAQLTRLESETNSHSLEIKNLKDQLKTSLSENKILNQRVEELQNETVQLSEIINETYNSNNVIVNERSSVAEAENGEQMQKDINGESGWSDFDEFDVDNPTTEISEKSKKDHVTAVRFSPGEIMEIAKLRVKLKSVEADLDQTKLIVQKQLDERDHLMRKVELAEADAVKRLKEVEAKEAERIEAHNQFKRILGMVEEREAKLRNAEELTEKLRNELMKWQEEVRRLEDQKKTAEFKQLEVDQELKRLKAEYAKLETRNFHELRQCKQTIAALQQQSLEQVHLSNPSANMLGNTNVLSMSASSSDRDYDPSLNCGLVVSPLLSHVRPLWDDESPE
ncbi:unnamed protein product, partial [Onchocerca ochengi]|uniref:SERPIN domain-containing protein n=1 Tax=Onchocerca ochengi TaxID=42157 RepID=A0A182EDF8_ONCOC